MTRPPPSPPLFPPTPLSLSPDPTTPAPPPAAPRPTLPPPIRVELPVEPEPAPAELPTASPPTAEAVAPSPDEMLAADPANVAPLLERAARLAAGGGDAAAQRDDGRGLGAGPAHGEGLTGRG